jgi:NADPH:quinone reductase-like Zn-dependent oxidoreductase
MKAAVRDRYGPPEVVRVEEVERPTPTGDEILVRVVSASVNRADLDGLYPRWAFIRLFLGVRAPRKAFRRLGVDVAGVVDAVGPDASKFKVGDSVFSDISAFGSGAFAEFVCGRDKAFAPIPAGWSHEDASTLGHSGVLAVRGVGPRAGQTLGSGMRVLIVGASGNVGPFCVQIAKSLGAHVTGVASGDKLDFVRSLGADEVIDYGTTDYTRPAEPYDRIVDVTAHHALTRWRPALKAKGVYLSFGGSAAWLLASALSGPFISLASGKSIRPAFVAPFGEKDVERVTELAERRVLKPVIDKRFALDDVAAALRYVDDGKPRGKVLVIP